MRNSGIEWIGEIPDDWEVVYLSSIFDEHKRKNTGLICKNLLSLSYGKIKRKDINTTDGLLPESFEGYNIIDKGDIVLRLTDLQNDQRSLRTGIALETGLITSAYTTIRCLPNIAYPDYMHYYLHSFDTSKGFYGMGDGVRQGLNYEGIKKILMLLPPMEVQQAIAEYLDKKCAMVERLIENQRGQIEKLKEYKQSVITEAVTKGLDPTVPMKHSGVDWIGDIPKAWEVTSLKFLCSMQAGKNLISEQITDKDQFPVYGGNGIRGYYDKYNYTGEYVLIGRQGALCGNVHIVCGDFWATEHAIVTTCNENILCKYFYYLLTGINLNRYVSNTAAQPGLAVKDILNIKTCICDFEEQQEIAEYLDKKCAEIDRLIAIKQQKIEKLNDYKKSLIYEYVTGKKQVG